MQVKNQTKACYSAFGIPQGKKMGGGVLLYCTSKCVWHVGLEMQDDGRHMPCGGRARVRWVSVSVACVPYCLATKAGGRATTIDALPLSLPHCARIPSANCG